MNPAIIAPAEVTPARIKDIFDSAFIDAAITQDGKVDVVESGLKTILSVDADRQLITFWLAFGCRRGARTSDVAEFAMEVNKNLIFVRAFPIEGGVLFDYSLPYDAGLLPRQLISAYRWFRKVAVDGIQAYDRKNVLG